MTIARGTILPVFRFILMAFVAYVTWLITDVLLFAVVSFLAFLTEITSIQKP
jgi:hypothetical protein